MKYKKKPVVIEAFCWTGGFFQTEDPEWIVEKIRESISFNIVDNELFMFIETLEGEMRASQGDYIIKGIQGEIYPCKPDIFLATYEAVE